jgi:pimeloyl-ACP methyl ester carboxylesterase
VRLHTSRRGSGPRHVALIHGLGSDGETWRELADLALATGRYTITTVDLRGHGRSDRAATYTVAAFADDLVENLPTGLDDIVSHSLGGPVVAQAVERLQPKHALYLDPGFKIGLPTTGVRGWLVKNVKLSLPLFLLAGGRGVRTPALSTVGATLQEQATALWDKRMALDVFRDVAFSTRPAAAAAIPSTVLLSEDAPFVIPDPVPAELQALGWDVRRVEGLGHSLWLEDPQKVWDAVADVF